MPTALDDRLVAVLGDRSEVRAVVADLVRRYAEPQRAYHTMRHLSEMSDALDRLTDAVPPAVLCALWWHDAVYDPAAADNEERSADLARDALTGLAAAPALIEETVRLVRLTATHRPAREDEGGMLLCDADLAVLAAEPSRYDEYAAAVRLEYAAVDDDAFRLGRAQVLRSLSAGAWIYSTGRARQLWEQRARDNLGRELQAVER